jgi:hypothetical protein
MSFSQTTLERADCRELRAIEAEYAPDRFKAKVLKALRGIPPEWDDARRWVTTLSDSRHGTINYGGREGDLAFRLVAVANGRWYALPFLRAGETQDFIDGLTVFAERQGIRLWIWRHPGSDLRLGSHAELIFPPSEIVSTG